ncbi:MAG: 50S ribosomal protein L14e [Candidatus Micrarchaeota archaeon]|nr:50S ribosomal protein L14e [Candidatus Micrarchaeota archaeon]
MVLLEEGRLCVKKLGRDAGDRAVITKVIDANFVNIISSSRAKERRCNVRHLEFLSEKVDPNNKEQLARALEIEASKLSGAPKAPAQKKEKKQ